MRISIRWRISSWARACGAVSSSERSAAQDSKRADRICISRSAFVTTISVAGLWTKRSCARSLARSTSPPLQETARAKRAVVIRERAERRAAFSACARDFGALATRLPGDHFVTHTEPALYGPFGLVVVRHFL